VVVFIISTILSSDSVLSGKRQGTGAIGRGKGQGIVSTLILFPSFLCALVPSCEIFQLNPPRLCGLRVMIYRIFSPRGTQRSRGMREENPLIKINLMRKPILYRKAGLPIICQMSKAVLLLFSWQGLQGNNQRMKAWDDLNKP